MRPDRIDYRNNLPADRSKEVQRVDVRPIRRAACVRARKMLYWSGRFFSRLFGVIVSHAGVFITAGYGGPR